MKQLSQNLQNQFFSLKLAVGNMPTGGAAATAAAFHTFRGLRHSMAGAPVCCSLNERQVLILVEKLGVIIVVAIFLLGIVLRVKEILANDGYRGDKLKGTFRKTLGCKFEVVLRFDESL